MRFTGRLLKIERCLFLLIKVLCKKELNYELQGFSKNHIDKLTSYATNNLSNKPIISIINKTYQLKIFLQKMSSENGYVRGDALSRQGLNRKNVFSFIKEQMNSIINQIKFSKDGILDA